VAVFGLIIWFCHTFRDAGRGCPEVRDPAAADSLSGVLTSFLSAGGIPHAVSGD
jgi:hypothetical protein